MRGRLYRRIFVFLLLFVAAALALSALASHLLLSELVRGHLGEALSAHALSFAATLPGADRPVAEQQAALERLARTRGVGAALWSADRRRLAFTDIDLPAPRPGAAAGSEWLPSPTGPALAVPLPDGRTLVLQPHHFPRPGRFLMAVLAVAALLALASYPTARFVTRRLERLETGVRRLGEGDLGARVAVEGSDELASLAASFNRTAERLQALVEGQRRMLASASHELRSPLTRLRLGLELARESGGEAGAHIAEAVAEVAELDALVEELLVAGRLELQQPDAAEPVDVGELLVSEAARTGASAAGGVAPFRGDPRLLRVMLRNLLENARRHGLGAAVEAGVEALPGPPRGVLVWVADRGPGVPDAERERIFEPFYRRPGHAEGRDGGVGLGLYLVRRIARCYAGTAVCLAREGGGTRFAVRLFEPSARSA